MIIPLKSVIMMIGPSGCSKSTFIKNQLVPQLKCLVPGANIQILSSDDYRREIIGKDLNKTDGRMKYASEGAFKLMETKFDTVTTWPITADFVILDATFIGSYTREQFVEKAKKAQYQLVGFLFDFDNREEYFKYIIDPDHRYLIGQHLKRFHKELGEIGRRDFDYFYKIKSKDHYIELEKDQSYDLMQLAKLPKFNSYFVVGDLHGCLEEFKELLCEAGFEIDNGNRINGNVNTLIILTGDIPDRGNEVSELIDFILVNISRIKICKGGHDRYLLKYSENGRIGKVDGIVDGIVDRIVDDGIKKDKLKHFDSKEKLDPKDLSKFETIMENQWYFYIHNHFVITHSPCENRYIGKFDKFSIRKQRSDSYPHREDYASEEEYIDDLRKHFSYILNDGKRNDPIHIFGHVSVNNAAIVENKIFLDTGCVYGNKLSGVWINAEYDKVRLKLKSVPSSYPKDSSDSIINIDDLNIKKDNDIKFESLEFEDKIDILEFAKNKINFISGTMSPCSANRKEKTLEDMREAFSYYRDNGIEKVMLQKKYMGSRSNMYLFPKDIEKSYMVSRNGFVIRRLYLKPLYEKMLNFLADKNDENNNRILNSELVIIDGELMPWSALGGSLIQSHFMTVGKGVESELQLLEETCFEIILEDVKKKYVESGYKDLRKEHKKEDLKKIMGENQYRQMYAIDNFRWMNVKEQIDAINKYNKQIDIYGKESDDIYFRPFAILKIVRDDCEELFWNSSNDFVFTTVSDDQCLMVSTDNIGLDNARKWFDKIVKVGYEGVVVKPLEKVYTPGIAPYIKVRNPNYLTIIYGYDYLIEPKFSQKIENKNIRNKLRMSIKEFEIGKRMLEIPYNEINENNTEYLNLFAQMVIEEKKEKELDPRL